MGMLDLEREFGKDYKERFREGLIKEFADDAETRRLFDDVCSEIKKSCLPEEELIEMLKVLPSNIAFAIVRNLDQENEGQLISLLSDGYLIDFKNSCCKGAKQSVDDRMKFKKSDMWERFLSERLITRHEIDCVVRYESRKNGDKSIYLNLYAEKPYHGDNETIKKLLYYREKIQRTITRKKIDEIIDLIKQPLLKNLLDDLKKVNQNIEV